VAEGEPLTLGRRQRVADEGDGLLGITIADRQLNKVAAPSDALDFVSLLPARGGE